MFRPFLGSALRFAAAIELLRAALVAAPASASATIDDFEIAAFSFQSAGNFVIEDVVLGSPHIHSIAGVRNVQLYSDSGVASVSSSPGTALDDQAFFTVVGGGFCRMTYEPDAPFDLTQGGANNRIRVRLGAAAVGSYIQVGIQSAQASETRVQHVTWSGAQFLDWLLEDFQAVNVEAATSVSVYFGVPGDDSGSFLIRGIDLTGPPQLPYFFEPIFAEIFAPPIPTPPLRFSMSAPVEQPLFEVFAPLVDVRDVTGLVPAVRAFWTDSPDPGGEIAGIFLQRSGVQPEPFHETTFRMGVDPEPFLGGDAVSGVEPEPFLVGNRSFLLQWSIVVSDDRGELVGTSHVLLYGDVHEGTPLEFTDVRVAGTDREMRGETFGGLELTMTVKPTGTLDVDAPLLDLTWVADWVPAGGTTNAVVPSGAGGGAFALVAAPSVTRGSVALRANRPFAAGVELEIFDVAGRAVRRLRPSAGARDVVWNGSCESGAPAPSGVYFARVAGGAGSAARIVRIR